MSEKVKNKRKSRQDNRINNKEISENTEENVNSKNQKVNYIKCNEVFNSEYDSSDDNYVAMVENTNKHQLHCKT